MAQNEEMKRLLLKGKIVANRLHCSLKQAENKLPHYLIESLKNQGVGENDLIVITCEDGEYWHGCYVNHDSFELGIKVGDEWWFEGDMVGDVMDGKPMPEGIVTFDNEKLYWHLMGVNGEEADGIWYLLKRVKLKVIGNIHDNPELLEKEK